MKKSIDEFVKPEGCIMADGVPRTVPLRIELEEYKITAEIPLPRNRVYINMEENGIILFYNKRKNKFYQFVTGRIFEA